MNEKYLALGEIILIEKDLFIENEYIQKVNIKEMEIWKKIKNQKCDDIEKKEIEKLILSKNVVDLKYGKIDFFEKYSIISKGRMKEENTIEINKTKYNLNEVENCIWIEADVFLPIKNLLEKVEKNIKKTISDETIVKCLLDMRMKGLIGFKFLSN